MDLLSLTVLTFWIYETTADSSFCVSIEESTNSIRPGETLSLDCNIFGLSEVNNIELHVEILLRQNQYIKRIVKVFIPEIAGKPSGHDNYSWMATFHYKNDSLQNRTSLKLDVFNTSASDEGLYLCYATLINVTKYNSTSIHYSNTSKETNLSNYVIMPETPVSSLTSIPYNCTKYGFSVFEDDSFLHQIILHPNESAFFPFLPTFNVNNKSIVISKPWVSYEGCYNYTVDKSKEEDCTEIDVTEWTTSINRLPIIGITKLKRCILLDLDQIENATAEKVSFDYCREDITDSIEYMKLYSVIDRSPVFHGEKNSNCNAAYMDTDENILRGIPCSETDRCDTFCLRHDGSNVTCDGFNKWKDAMDICNSQNKSLPNINSTNFIPKNNGKIICLSVYQNSSFVFRPVIKQVTNKDGNTTFEPTTTNRSLPFLCRVKTEKPKPCSNVYSTKTVQSTGIRTVTHGLIHQKNLIIITVPSAVGFVLIVVVSCFIHRFKRKRASKRIKSSDLMCLDNIYSHPVDTEEAAPENMNREQDKNIVEQQQEEYSNLLSADKNEFNETCPDDQYSKTEGLDEYDVLRGKRENQEVSIDANIYDRTNNSFSGIYDSTLTREGNDTLYNL